MTKGELEAKRWWHEAQNDLNVVKTLTSSGFHAAACGYAQQAAEKALKAVLFSQGSRVVLGHSILDLLRRIERFEGNFQELRQYASLLDQFYIPTRYPNGLPWPATPSETYTAKQSEEALTAATEFLSKVEQSLRTKTQVMA